VSGKLKDTDRSLYVDGQEKGARGFERYFKTGKAPSEKLLTSVRRLQKWLTNIYGAIRGKDSSAEGATE
jgi:hypothetical protein